MNVKHLFVNRGKKKISPDNFTIKMSIFEFTES